MYDKQIITIGYYEMVETMPDYEEKVLKEIRVKGTFDKRVINVIENGNVNGDIKYNSVVYVIYGKKRLPTEDMIAYVKVYNKLWNVTSISYEYPEIVISLGGIYNGNSL